MSSRQERNTRSNGRHDSVAVPETTRSSPADSSEGEGPTARELRRTRSQRRDQGPQGSSKQPADQDAAENDAEEDVTRCICRLAEYPGPPYGNDRNLQDGGFFIQCEKCNVWQHAGCVGFFDEDACPRHYYCETCRPDLHKIMTGKLGYQCSHYGRANGTAAPAPPTSSRPSAKESESRSSKERDGKASAAANSLATAKRRATMNSRAAYDDEEVLRIIEESKRNGGTVESTNGSRKSKRGREGSEESEHEHKRRRTGSPSGSPTNADMEAIEADSDADESRIRSNAAQSSKRSRVSSQVNVGDKERRRDKELEQERLDIAARRKSRPDRRRGDESETVDDAGKAASPSKAVTSLSRSTKPSNGRQAPPTATQNNLPSKRSKAATRRGKVGRNQYTKERDALADARASEVRPSYSRDGEDGNGSSDGQANLLPNGSKPAKPKYMNPNRTSMNELRKRAAGILEFISRTQIEMAVDKPPSEANTPAPAAATPSSSLNQRNGNKSATNGMSKLSNEIHSDAIEDASTDELGGSSAKPTGLGATSPDDRLKVDEDTFKSLDTVQMMDVLSRDIHLWQQLHGKWGTAKEIA